MNQPLHSLFRPAKAFAFLGLGLAMRSLQADPAPVTAPPTFAPPVPTPITSANFPGTEYRVPRILVLADRVVISLGIDEPRTATAERFRFETLAWEAVAESQGVPAGGIATAQLQLPTTQSPLLLRWRLEPLPPTGNPLLP